MSKYEIIFAIEPSGAFGVPEEGVTVVPVGTKIELPALDTWSGTIAGYGTMSQFRRQPIEACMSCKGAHLQIGDNLLRITIRTTDDSEAISSAQKYAEQFCKGLTLKLTTYFSARMIGGACVDSKTPVRRDNMLHLGSVRSYNLGEISKVVGSLENFLECHDSTLDAATTYFYHAVYLQEALCSRTHTPSVHTYYALTQVILHYNKAITCIIGDRACGDKTHSQYKKHGISEELWKRAKPVQIARNAKDVAHYKVEQINIQELRQDAKSAQAVATDILVAYLDWLTSGSDETSSG